MILESLVTFITEIEGIIKEYLSLDDLKYKAKTKLHENTNGNDLRIPTWKTK